MGDERAHAVQLGEGQRLLVVGHAAFSIELVGMGCQVTEKMQSMGPKAGLVLRGYDRAIAQVPALLESSEQQTSAADCNVGPATMTNDSTRCLFIQEPLGLLDPAQRPLYVASLRQRPSRGGNRPWKKHGDGSAPDPVLDQRARPAPVTLGKVEDACGQVRPTNGVGVLRWLGELDRFRLVLACLGKSAELGETHHQPDAAENGWWHGQT